MLKFSCNIDYIPVSVDFIENYMPEANGAYVKVYLLALSLAVYGYEMSASSIASQLNLLESDVINAFDYWNKKGALKYDKDSGNISFSAKEENINVSIPTRQAEPIQNTESSPSKKSIDQVSNAMTQNKELADLCLLAQEILGKTLTNSEIETLYYFYDELQLSPEVITILLEYCVSNGKKNMNYIEKVAISWNKNDLAVSVLVEPVCDSGGAHGGVDVLVIDDADDLGLFLGNLQVPVHELVAVGREAAVPFALTGFLFTAGHRLSTDILTFDFSNSRKNRNH